MSIKKFFLFFCGLLPLFACHAPRESQPNLVIGQDQRSEILSSAFPAASLVYISIASQEVCSGSIIGKRYILSAAHCFPEADSSTVIGIQNFVDDIMRLGVQLPIRHIAPKALSLRILHKGAWHSEQDVANDWAILEVMDQDFDGSLLSMPLVLPTDKVGAGVAGYSLDRFDRLGSASVDFDCMAQPIGSSIVEHDCDTVSGSSGGPIWQIDVARQKIAQIGVHAGALDTRNIGPATASFRSAVEGLGIKVANDFNAVPTKNLFLTADYPNRSWGARGAVVAFNASGAPEPLVGQAGTVVGQQLFVWGGYNESGMQNSGSIYNFESNSWTTMPMSDEASARFGHTVAAVKDNVVIWGGGNGKCEEQGAIFNLTTKKWTAVTRIGQPVCRTMHSAVGIEDKMIIWGGTGAGNFFDPGIFDATKKTWSRIDPGPDSRTGHSAVAIGRKMIIWGGSERRDFKHLADGAVYDLEKNSWAFISSTNAPSPRSRHAAAAVGRKMIIWGGIAENGPQSDGGIYDLDTDSWSALSFSNLPSARSGMIAGTIGDKMIIWGGVNRDLRHKEGWILDFSAGSSLPQ